MGLMPEQRPAAYDSGWLPTLLKYGSRAQVLLLEHVGRKSGRRLTTPLLYLVDGDDLVVVASQGGLPSDPQWYRNLVAAPDARVHVGREVVPVRARRADATEKAALWPRLVDLYADFEAYQQWAGDRDIPVVVLERR